MAISFILNDEAVNDQTAGLQTDDSADGFTDTDVTYGSLFALYGAYLETTLGLSNAFPTNVGVATKTNSVTVNASTGAQLTGITFTDSAGGALTGDPATDDSGLDTVDGKSIILVAGPDGSGVDGDNVVIGKYDSDGNGSLDATAFVIIKEEVLNAGATSAEVTFHVITYVPIAHGDPNDPDDAVNLGNSLKLSASETVTFSFGGTPSGNHLFTMVTAGGIGLVVTPETEVIKLHISQGGGPTTLGVFNQMIDPGEAMVFTFVTNPDPTVTVPSLSQGEADAETNILFGGVHTTTGGSVVISQTQGNDPAGMRLTALNTQGDGSATEPSGDGFINGYGNDPIAAISEVRIFDDTGTLLLTATGDVAVPVNGITVDFLASGEVEVRGLEDDYKVEYDAASHERLKVTGLEGKFDIGGIGIESSGSESTFVGQQIVIEDDGPATSANATVLLDDDALTGGNPGGSGDDADAANTSGTLGHSFGTDGAGSIAFLTTGAPAGFTYELSGSDLLIKQGGTTVVTVTLNTATGAYTVTQNAPILHAAGSAENNQAFTLSYQVTDGDGDTANGTLGINVDDDTPTTSANATAQLDDDALAGGNPGGIGDDADAANLSGTLGHSFGADGGSIAFLTTGAPAGFTYELSGSDLLIKQGGTTVVTVSLNTATGAYSVTQNAPILHAAGLDENNQAFTLNYQVTDGDGDTANGTLAINVDDDTPIIGPISDGFVDFAAGDSDTKSLNGSVGADGPATYSITSFPATVTIFDGTSAQLTLLSDISPDSTVVNYFQDNDGSGTRTAGDTDFFRLTLAGGNYTFDVLQDPPPATLEFDFDELPSGANLFGVVGTASTDPAIIVIGENISLKADNTYDNKSDTIHTSQGGEGATIGLNNQLLDNIGEGIYFTYVDEPVQDFLSGAPGGLTATEADDADNIQYTGGTLEVGTASFTISQMQGNDLAAVTINAYDILDAPQGVDFVSSLGTGTARPIDDVRVFDENGTLIETFDGSVNDPNVTIKIDGGVATVSGLDEGYTVEWDTVGLHDRVLIQNAGGQFDIGRFVIEQPQPTPDEKLDFAVQIADADGDTATATFSVGIDGTGIFDDGVITV